MARTFPPKVDGPPPTGGGRDTGGETSQREMGDAGDFGVGGQYGTTLASYQVRLELWEPTDCGAWLEKRKGGQVMGAYPPRSRQWD